MKITRTVNENGTYRYEIDGKVIYVASKVLYTHASTYAVNDSTPVLFHKTEGAAGRAKGYPKEGWVKTAVLEIEGPVEAPAEVAPVEVEAPAAEATTTFEVVRTYGDTVIDSRTVTLPNSDLQTPRVLAREALKAWGVRAKMSDRREVMAGPDEPWSGLRWTLTERGGWPAGAVTVASL
jgi:hypothetical protein